MPFNRPRPIAPLMELRWPEPSQLISTDVGARVKSVTRRRVLSDWGEDAATRRQMLNERGSAGMRTLNVGKTVGEQPGE